MKLKNFNSTPHLFDTIQTLLASGDARKVKVAGDLFEQYSREWHLEFNDYIEVYDANQHESIPAHIIDKISGWDLLSKGANSAGIDKIAITRFGEIDVHQDKSTLHIDKNISVQKCSLMMSLRDNGLQNIRNFVLNTMAEDLSHYASIWADQRPLVYAYTDFCPAELDADAVEKDLAFWAKIKKPNATQLKINNFVPRGQEQVDYINTVKKKLIQQLETAGYAKGFAKGAGSLGKSVLDPVLMAEIQNSHWSEYLTNSKSPVTVSFYHSSKTINSNGWEEVQRRRAAGIYDEVIVVSGTEIIDQDGNVDNISDKFVKSINAVNITMRVVKAISEKKSVLLITLYHHSETIQEVQRLIRKQNKKFIFWARKRDECDWPCSNYHSSFAPALDDRTESVVTFGSTGTERWGDPHKDYGTNNLSIHGPLLHSFSWADAESADLVKKLIMITPGVKVSELAGLFPNIVNKDGTVDLDLRVEGVPVDNTYPTAEQILKIACVAKALLLYPQAQRSLMFSNFVKTNMLIQANWKWVCNRVLGKTNAEKKIKNLHIEVMNDDVYNTKSVRNHTTAIKRAKGKGNYVIGSCRLFNRGYDDKPPHGYKGAWLRHNSGFHIDKRNEVNLVQEIWRFTRLDKNDSDPFAYYICPMIYNDLAKGGPTWSESTIATLTAILKHNKNIKDDFESLMKNPSTRQSSRKGNGPFRFWIPTDFDPSLLNNLITTTAQTSKGIFYSSLYIEAHDWLTEKYLELEEYNQKKSGDIKKDFLKIEKFVPLYSSNKQKSLAAWVHWFFKGGISRLDSSVKQHINDNLLEIKKHEAKQKEFLSKKIIAITDRINKFLKAQVHNDKTHTKGMYDIIAKEFSFTKSDMAKTFIYNKGIRKNIIINDKKYFKETGRQVYKILLDVASENIITGGQHKWATIAREKFTEYGLEESNLSSALIIKHFISKDNLKVLNKTEWSKFCSVRDPLQTAFRVSSGKSIVMSNKVKKLRSKKISAAKTKYWSDKRKLAKSKV